MNKIYHILNGDALFHQLHGTIVDEQLVMRECLVDGPVSQSLIDIDSRFFADRANYLSDLTGESLTYVEYGNTIGLTFEQIQSIPPESQVYLWFEHDLFCQANCWFLLWILSRCPSNLSIFLVQPKESKPYHFGWHSQDELLEIFNDAKPVSHLDILATLWPAYCKDEFDKLLSIAFDLKPIYPYIHDAVQAHIDRQPIDSLPGRPIQTLKALKKEMPTASFGEIFGEFSKREAIYGYGDLQARRLLEETE